MITTADLLFDLVRERERMLLLDTSASKPRIETPVAPAEANLMVRIGEVFRRAKQALYEPARCRFTGRTPDPIAASGTIFGIYNHHVHPRGVGPRRPHLEPQREFRGERRPTPLFGGAPMHCAIILTLAVAGSRRDSCGVCTLGKDQSDGRDAPRANKDRLEGSSEERPHPLPR
jgi:hypothetical protein